MEIKSVYSAEFRPYGKVLDGYDTAPLCKAMEQIPMPERGVSYEAGIGALEQQEIFWELQDGAFGGMPIQLGMCWGYNTKLNCLEYHRDSEINIGTGEYILLLAKQDKIENGILTTDKVRAFRVPAGVVLEVYATTLHYAPCQTQRGNGFRVAVVLPRGTNTQAPEQAARNEEDTWLTARNKWLLAHPDTSEAAGGAHVGLVGPNLDIAPLL